MRYALLIGVLALSACEVRDYGYKDNPFAILVNAHFAVRADDLSAFSKVFGREALCVWGSTTGMATIRDGLPSDIENLHSEIILSESHYLTYPRFVGYWSYFKQRYTAQLFDKNSRVQLAEAIIDCHFGVDGVKRESDRNQPMKYYPEKHCKVISFKAMSFRNVETPAECDMYQAEDDL